MGPAAGQTAPALRAQAAPVGSRRDTGRLTRTMSEQTVTIPRVRLPGAAFPRFRLTRVPGLVLDRAI